MRVVLIVVCSFITSMLAAQVSSTKRTDMFANDIEKNIVRATITVLMPYDNGWPIAFSYERQLAKPLTAVVKAGPIFRHNTFGSGSDPNQFFMSGYGSAEVRYYFNLLRRIRKEKHVRNFSANYLSLEQEFMTNPLVTINVANKDDDATQSYTYLNIGYQKQFKQKYFGAFIGPSIHLGDLVSKGFLTVDTFHFGLTFGFVLFE